MFCSQCGTQATDPTARFCKACGARLGVAPQPMSSVAAKAGDQRAIDPGPYGAPTPEAVHSVAGVRPGSRIAILLAYGAAIVAVGFAVGYFTVSRLLNG